MSSVSPRDGEAPFQAPRPLPQLTAPPDGGGEGHSSHQRSRSPGGQSPARKRMRVDLAGLTHSARVKRICEHRLTRLRQVSTACRENMTELFFLSTQRNIIDMPGFRKKPSTEFVTFLKNNKAPDRVISEVQTAVLGNIQSGHPEPRKHIYSPRLIVLPPVKVGHQQDIYNARAPPLSAPSRTLPPLPPPSAPSYTPEQVQEKVRQEGWVIRRVQELARDGMWPANRLPKVVEQPRPLAAWDMVLQEMKWMAADFQQERLWKQSAARVQAAAVKQFVADRNQRREQEASELESHMAQRRIASSMSTQVKAYWNNMVGLHEYEVQKRHNLYLSKQLAAQLGHVTDLQQDSIGGATAAAATTSALVAASRKRKLDSGLGPGSSGRSSPVVSDSLHSSSSSSSPTTTTPPTENGGGSNVSVSCMSEDEESTIEEQEDYERFNCVIENEVETLVNDAKTDLNMLLRHEYPGALTDYLNDQPLAEDWEADDFFGGGSAVEDSDAQCGVGDHSDNIAPSHRVYSLHTLLPHNKERTSSGSNISSIGSGSEDTNNKINGDLNRKDLIELSETAETHLPKSVINCNSTITVQQQQTSPLFKGRLREYQTVAVQWLDKMYSAGLPAILADESGLGRKVVTAAFISNLVNSVQSKGPHILIVPSSSLHCWQRTFTKLVPGVRCSIVSPATMSLAHLHHLLSSEARMSSSSPHLFIATYKSFFQMPHLLTSTRWNVALLAEAQNLVAAGSPDQLRALAALTSHHRILIMTGPQKENPIDLWNVVHLLFPGLTGHEGVDGSTCVVEGTSEYTQTVQRLQKLVAAFTLARTRHKHPGIEKQVCSPTQVPMYVNLSSRQKKLYDDYLAKPNTQEMLKGGDLSSVCSIVQQLRNICNHSSLVSTSPHPLSSPPRLKEVCPHPPRPLTKLLSESALDRVSFDNMNLVFLKQELSTTVLTSARLRSLKASRELIQELADPTANETAKNNNRNNRHFPPRVPTGKLTFTLEGITRTVNGWNVPGGWVEGMGLVKAGTGQVFKVCANPTTQPAKIGGKTTSTSPSRPQPVEILKSIAEINQWRCSGFPLYGQDLIQSLTITNSIRPARSRFCGQGYINCFTEACRAAQQSSHLLQEKDDWRYRTCLLRPLLSIGTDAVQTVHSSVNYLTKLDTDPTFHSSKLQALCRILEERYKNRERVIVILNSAHLITTFKNFYHWKSFRCMLLMGDSSLEYLRCQLETFHLDSRYFVLTLVAFQTFAGLDIPSVGTVVEYDWTPLSTDLSTRGLTSAPNTIIRLICRGTLEESASRRTLHTKIYTELDANTDSPCIKKQTLDELFRPSSDNGFLWMQDRKKKDKNQCKEEESGDLSQQVLALLGLACPDQTNTLLDLAELDCLDQDVDDMSAPLQYEDADLMAWLESIPPISRYGMRQLSECNHIWDKDGWSNHLSNEQQLQETKKKIEEDITRKGRKRKLEEESVEYVTYPSMLVNRQWKDDQGDLTHWKPPTYLDPINDDSLTHLMYKTTPMPEEDLPPVHIKKEKKRDAQGCNSLVSSPASSLPASPIDKPKIKREENVACAAPRSIFDRPKQFKAMPRARGVGIVVGTVGGNSSSNSNAQMNYMSNSGISQGAITGTSTSATAAANNLTGKSATPADVGPEWLIQEDWALHQAVLKLQEMPLSLSAVSPAHISNWDLVADIVNSVSRCFRSARQCRSRYEATIQPREEGKLLYNDITPTKKQKKTKINIKGGQIQPQADKKPSISKPMKTSVLFKQDNNNAWSSQFSHKFETIKCIANKRTPTTKPVLVNSTQRNPKHASVLAEWNVVNYDVPLGPAEVAANRVERLQRDKARTQQQQQQLAAVQQQQNVVTVPSQQQVSVQQQSVQAVQQQTTPQQQVVATGHQTRLGVSSVSIPTAIVGNQGAVVSVNSSLPQAVVVSISQPVQQQQVLTSVGQITGVNNRPIVTQAVVSVSGVLPTNLQQNSNAFTRLAGGQIIVSQAGKAVGGAQTATRSPLTPAQIKMLQAQSLQKQQQNRQRQVQLGNASVAAAVVNNTAVTTSVVAATAAITNSATRTIPGTSGIGRGQIVRPTTVRSMSEAELKAMWSKQQLKGVVQVAPGSLSAAQLQQLGISLAGQVGSSGAALVKTTGPVVASVQQTTGATPITTTTIAVSQQMQVAQQQLQQQGKSVTIPLANLQGQQLKAVATGRGGTTVVAAQVAPGSGSGTTVTAQQMQQWRQLMARKGLPQNVALKQVAAGGKLPTQLIVQGAGQQGKTLPAATMLQLQQIAKNVAGGSTVQIQGGSQQVQLSHTVLQAKPGAVQPGQTVQARVIPVSGSGGRGQQTIQVVAAGPAVQRTGGAVPNVTLDALSRQQGASAIASALAAGNHVKINAPGGATQQQILSQVTAALAGQAGQNVSVAVRTPASNQSIVTTQQLAARTVNTIGSTAGQQSTTLVVNQPQQQLTLPSQQLVAATGSQVLASQAGVVSSQQQLLTSQQPQLISAQQLVTNQQQLVVNQPQQQIVQTSQQQMGGGLPTSQIQSSEST